MIFGFIWLTIIACLAIAIGLGEVKSETSYGLMPLVTALASMGGSFATWAFRERSDKAPEKKPDDDQPSL